MNGGEDIYKQYEYKKVIIPTVVKLETVLDEQPHLCKKRCRIQIERKDDDIVNKDNDIWNLL